MNPATIKLVVTAVVLAAAFGAGWAVNGLRYQAAQKQAIEEAVTLARVELQKNIDDLSGRLKQAEALAATAASERDAGKVKVESLQGAVALLRGQLTNREEVTENGTTTVTVRRSTAYRVCANAGVTGDATAIAECQASSVPRTVQDQ